MWEKEEKIIEGLGLLYSDFPVNDFRIRFRFYCKNGREKVWWLYWLCVHHLKQRMASLEGYMKYYNQSHWHWYKAHFGIED